MQILSDTQSVDFGPYLNKSVLASIRQHWYSLISDSAGMKKGLVVIEFRILKDGSVAGLKIATASGDLDLDRPAYGSITVSNPFPPLPSEFKGPYLGLRFSFYYNLQAPKASSTQPPPSKSIGEEDPPPKP